MINAIILVNKKKIGATIDNKKKIKVTSLCAGSDTRRQRTQVKYVSHSLYPFIYNKIIYILMYNIVYYINELILCVGSGSIIFYIENKIKLREILRIK